MFNSRKKWKSEKLNNGWMIAPYCGSYFLNDIPLWLREMTVKNIKRFEQEWIQI